GLTPTPPEDVCVFMGPCSKGPSGTNPANLSTYISAPISFGNIGDLVADRGTGPVVKKAAYSMSKTGGSVVVVRLPKTARLATKSAVDISDISTPSLNPTLSGTPNDQYSVVVEFTTGGTTGTTGMFYRYSLNGGVDYTAPIALGTALTLAALATATGVTVTL